jgi:tRNA(fMet)-specific endonuclease VapC
VTREYLLDTNILSASFRRDRRILHRISEVDYYLSTIVAGELYEWALLPTPNPQRLEWLRQLLQIVPVLLVDEVTSERFGMLSGQLKLQGISRADNDLWIAAQALQHNLIVGTRDTDFDAIPHLLVEHW